MDTIKLNIQILDKDIQAPTYTRESDVAFDLRSSEVKLIKPGERHLIKTGLKVEIPPGYAGLIWDRSGISSKTSIHCLAGVIDPGFRGEIRVVMHHLGDKDFLIEKNMRIAQMLIQPVTQVTFNEVEELSEDKVRGENGFGSSGLH